VYLIQGDPMMGWQTNPTFFFGIRNAEFKMNADNQVAINNAQSTSNDKTVFIPIQYSYD
jgi:hypothetical protein